MTRDEVRGYCQRPIAFHRAFLVCGGVKVALFLSQACYWSDTKAGDWFFKTVAEWEEETGLTRGEQEEVRKKLRDLGVLEEDRVGPNGRLHFRLDYEKLGEVLVATTRKNHIVEKPHSGKTSTRKNLEPERGKTSNRNEEKPRSLTCPENTSENTSEREERSVPIWLSPEEYRAMKPEQAARALARLADAGPVSAFTHGTMNGADYHDLREIIVRSIDRGHVPTQTQMLAATVAAEADYHVAKAKDGRVLRTYFRWKDQFTNVLAQATTQALANRDRVATREERALNQDHPDVPAKLLREQVGQVNFSRQDMERYNRWEMSKYELPEFQERHADYYAGLNGKAGANGK